MAVRVTPVFLINSETVCGVFPTKIFKIFIPAGVTNESAIFSGPSGNGIQKNRNGFTETIRLSYALIIVLPDGKGKPARLPDPGHWNYVRIGGPYHGSDFPPAGRSGTI
jgi:hypothetical protein